MNKKNQNLHRTYRMHLISQLIQGNDIHFSGKFDQYGNEYVAWACVSDAGQSGWMAGTFDRMENSPYPPTLSCKVFFASSLYAIEAADNGLC